MKTLGSKDLEKRILLILGEFFVVVCFFFSKWLLQLKLARLTPRAFLADSEALFPLMRTGCERLSLARGGKNPNSTKPRRNTRRSLPDDIAAHPYQLLATDQTIGPRRPGDKTLRWYKCSLCQTGG